MSARIRQSRVCGCALALLVSAADPNVWFGNVERLASERIGRETVTYVSNIYKYYVTYRLLSTQRERRAAAKATLKEGT
jgi:membrane-bound lytic murein transglycosylase MltF